MPSFSATSLYFQIQNKNTGIKSEKKQSSGKKEQESAPWFRDGIANISKHSVSTFFSLSKTPIMHFKKPLIVLSFKAKDRQVKDIM